MNLFRINQFTLLFLMWFQREGLRLAVSQAFFPHWTIILLCSVSKRKKRIQYPAGEHLMIVALSQISQVILVLQRLIVLNHDCQSCLQYCESLVKERWLLVEVFLNVSQILTGSVQCTFIACAVDEFDVLAQMELNFGQWNRTVPTCLMIIQCLHIYHKEQENHSICHRSPIRQRWTVMLTVCGNVKLTRAYYKVYIHILYFQPHQIYQKQLSANQWTNNYQNLLSRRPIPVCD